jgi:serine/threonine protein kinase/tetratricopeptide (TPR) repeat protein
MIGQTISHYKILEKLGEGGMGVVYKAHDTKLDRAVALKFLPHYLTSDAGEKERFYHEARAASALMHPNVAVIFEIDEFENQVFLSMELVDGKTLKKFVDQDSLPMRKVLDVAIQAAEGLAAAHEKGVVHRDIKSDNIMITPKGQVKIMDFGLAKVKGATKLTKAGSTLGTAAYMSPEQAQGEEVDHRSDIFSFGVVLYELLTTKLPFRGEHQAALMYSLIHEEPQPIARFNEKVTPDLERIVLKALAKEKDERYQHVDDMLADLRRERKNLEYARAGYATTSTIIQPAPSVASAHSMPPAQSTSAGQAVPPPPLKSGKGLLRYLLPASGVVVVVALLVIFNPFNFQIGTQKSSASPDKSSLAVMYFQNIPDPEDKDHTADMLADLLITALSQTKGLEVISRERLMDIQKEFQADSRSITPEMATRVAQRAGVTTMLFGSILQKEPAMAVTFRLIDVKSGNILGSQRLAGFSPDKIFSLVDTIAFMVTDNLKIQTAGPGEGASVASVTTKSPEAYRSYVEGIELNDRFYTAEAEAAFKRAIELDSTFAMAYAGLASVNLSSLSKKELDEALKKAYSLSGNVTERERLGIQSAYAATIERDIPRAISLLETLLQKYPRQQRAYLVLANNYGLLKQHEKAIDVYRRGLQVDSLDKNIWNALAYAYTLLGRREEAFQAIDRYLQLAPAEANPYDSKGDIYAMFDRADSAMIWWGKATTFRADFPSVGKMARLAFVRRDEASTEKYARLFIASNGEAGKLIGERFPIFRLVRDGKLSEARKRFLESLASHRALKLQQFIVGDLMEIAVLDYELGDSRAMVDHAAERTGLLRKDEENVVFGRWVLALAFAKAGKPQMARQITDSLKDVIGKGIASNSMYEFGMALLAFEEGDYDRALGFFESESKSGYPNHAPNYFHAVCRLKTGHVKEAVAEFDLLSRSAPIEFELYDNPQLAMAEYRIPIGAVKAHYWLGVAYEQQGQKDKAVKSYETFLDIWKNADFKSPEIADAKARLSKLKGMASN